VKFYSLFWDSVLLVGFNEYTNRQCLTQGGIKDVDESFSGVIYSFKILKVNKSEKVYANSDKQTMLNLCWFRTHWRDFSLMIIILHPV